MIRHARTLLASSAALALIVTPVVTLAQQTGAFSEMIALREQQAQQNAPQKKKGGIFGDILTVVVGVGSAALCGAFDKNNSQAKQQGCLALGAVAGFGALQLNKAIAKKLNEKEQAELLAAAGDSLSDGKPRTLAFPESGASASVTPTGTLVFEDAKVSMFYDSVALSSRERVEVIAQPYLTTKKVNLRGGPSTSAKVVRTLQANSAVHVVGKVPDQDWYMVSERVTDGENEALMVVGYVSSDMVQPADDNFVLPAQKAPKTVTMAEFDVALRCNEITYQLRDSKGKLVSDKSKNCIGPEGQPMSA